MYDVYGSVTSAGVDASSVEYSEITGFSNQGEAVQAGVG